MPKGQKFNPDWPSAKSDTKEAKAARKQAQRQREKAILDKLGFASITDLLAALDSGEYEIRKVDKAG